MTFQPIAALSIGGGYYVRSSGIWNFDISNNKRLIPLGIGFGKVFKTGNAIVNAFIEPQFTVYHDGIGLPSFQLFSGLQFLFKRRQNDVGSSTSGARYEPTLEEIQERAYEIYVQRGRIDGFDLADLASGGKRAER